MYFFMTACSIFILPRDLRAKVINMDSLLVKDKFFGVVCPFECYFSAII